MPGFVQKIHHTTTKRFPATDTNYLQYQFGNIPVFMGNFLFGFLRIKSRSALKPAFWNVLKLHLLQKPRNCVNQECILLTLKLKWTRLYTLNIWREKLLLPFNRRRKWVAVGVSLLPGSEDRKQEKQPLSSSDMKATGCDRMNHQTGESTIFHFLTQWHTHTQTCT